MTEAERRLIEDRTTRNAARGVFDANVAQVKADLAARSIKGRIADQATGEAKAALAEGLAVAKESKGIIAGTLGGLLLWFFRGPLLEAFDDLLRPGAPAPVQEAAAKPKTRRRRPKETQA
jgi:hypothetical protein